MQHALNDIATTMANGTNLNLQAVQKLLDYAHCNPNSEIKFRASQMILHVDSDAAYLVAPQAQSRTGG